MCVCVYTELCARYIYGQLIERHGIGSKFIFIFIICDFAANIVTEIDNVVRMNRTKSFGARVCIISIHVQ